MDTVLVLSGIELIFFPGASMFLIYYEKNVDNTLMFLIVVKKSRTFPVSHVQVRSR